MSKQEKYGFVYIWRDRKHKRYYIGCHWGNENDGYICSSTWMRNSFKRRPNDFKRRILISNIVSREETLLLEYKWLSLISDNEIGKKYYNLKKHLNGHWTTDGTKLQSVGEKIGKKVSAALKGRTLSEEHKQKLSESKKDKPISEEHKIKIREANLGKKLTEETKAKISASNKEKSYYDTPVFKEKMSKAAKNRSDETRKRISDNSKRLQIEGKIGMKGKKHSEETKIKMAFAARNRNK